MVLVRHVLQGLIPAAERRQAVRLVLTERIPRQAHPAVLHVQHCTPAREAIPAPNVRQRVSALGLTLLLLLNTLPAVRSLEQMEENMSQQVRPALLDTLLPNQAQASKV